MADDKGGGGQQLDPEALKKVKELTKQIADHVGETTESYQQQAQVVVGLRDSFTKMAEKIDSARSGMKSMSSEQLEQINDAAKKANGELTKFEKSVKSTGDFMGSKWVKAATVSAGALTGLRQGFKNLYAVLKTGFGILTSAASAIFSIGKAIVAMPLGILKKFVDMADAGGGGNELAAAYEKVREEFGAFSSVTSSTVISTTKSMMGMSEGGLSSIRVFGNMAEIMTKVTALAKAMGPQFTNNADEFMKNGKAILYYQKGLGLADEQMSAVAIRAGLMGETITKQLNDMTKQSYALAKAFGLDAKVISKDMGKAMSDVAHFGHLSQKELAVAVTYSNKLGVSIDKLTGLMDKFNTFDSAAESASALGEQFGVNIDAMELMSAQNPAKKMDILKQAFAATGKDLSKLTYQERSFIQQQTGLDAATFDAAMSQKNATVSMDKMTQAAEKAETAQLSQTAALKQLATATERLTPAGSSAKGFFGKFADGFKRGFESTVEFQTIMNNIRQIFTQFTNAGYKLGQMFVKVFPGVQTTLQGVADLFSPARFGKMLDRVTGIFEKFSSKNGGILGNFNEFMDGKGGLKEIFLDFFNEGKPGGKKFLEGLSQFWTTVLKILAEGAKYAIKELAGVLKVILDFLKNPQMPSLGGANMKPWMQPLLEIFEVIKKDLWPVLKDFGSFLWEKMKAVVMSPTGIKVMIGALLFVLAPALIGAVAGAASGGLFKSFGSSIIGAMGKGVKDAGAGGKATAALQAANKGISAATPDEDELRKLREVANSKIDYQKIVAHFVGMAAIMVIGLKAFEKALALVKDVEMNDIIAAGLVLVVVAKSMAYASDAAYMMVESTRLWGKEEQKSVMKGLLTVAAVLGVGLLAFGGAVAAVVAFNIKISDVLVAGALMLGTATAAIASIPLLFALKMANQSGVTPADIIKGGLALTLALGIVGVTGAALALLLREVGGSAAQLTAAGDFMKSMVLVFLGMIPLLAGAAALGAILMGPQGLFILAAAGTGMAAITAAVGAVSLAAVAIIQQIATLPVDKDFQPKVDAFLGIMRSIQAFVDAMVKVIELMNPSFMDFLTGEPTSFKEKADSAVKLINAMVGAAGSNNAAGGSGLLGIMHSVMFYVKEIAAEGGPKLGEAAKIFSEVMTSVSTLLQAMTPPPAFFEAQTSFINVLDPTIGRSLPTTTAQYAEEMQKQLKPMITQVTATVKDLSRIDIPDEKKAAAVGLLLSAITSVMKAITPDANLIKAFQKTTETSGKDLLGEWKSKDQSLDFTQFDKFMTDQAKRMETLIPMLTRGTVESLLSMVKDLKPEQLENLKKATEVVKLQMDMINAITNIMSSIKPETIETNKVDTIEADGKKTYNTVTKVSKASPTLEGVLDTLKVGIPGLLRSLVNFVSDTTVSKVLSGWDIGRQIENLTKIFGVIKAVGEFMQVLKNAGTNEFGMIGGQQMENNMHMMMGRFSNALWLMIAEPYDKQNNTMGPLPALMWTVDAISRLMSGEKVTNVNGTVIDAKLKPGSNLADAGPRVSTFLKAAAEIGTSLLAISGIKIPNDAATSIQNITKSMQGLWAVDDKNENLFSAISKATTAAMSYSPETSKKAFNDMRATLVAAQEMVKQVNDFNKMLSDEGGNTIKIKSVLDNLANNVGLGAGGKYEIKNRDVVIKVDLMVVMDAAKVENAIIQRRQSVIRDKLNLLMLNAGANKRADGSYENTPQMSSLVKVEGVNSSNEALFNG